MDSKLFCYWIFVCVSWINAEETDHTPAVGRKGTRCYDDFNRPQKCIPEFENAAYAVLMEATNTCGDQGQVEFCQQTGVTGIRKSCEICHPNQHSARYLTDFNSQDNQTWWQSETMLEGIQFPSQVNLTLNLGKAFDITYIRLWFYSPRPESFAIYKRTTDDGPWIPYQYYSATCRDTYGLPDRSYTTKGDESRALCKSEYSDISPLKNGNVAFSTLEGRPSAYTFDGSPELQEWVTATSLKISLDRLNTFGDEVFGDQQVLKSYFYAVADIAVGARCKCNGHAPECITSSAIDGSRRRVCKCEHNTAGPDCNECLPFYNDQPWRRGSLNNAYECKPCNCNGFSNRCYFDRDLYDRTGHGGHCLDCQANRDGPNCERCKENYYQREDHYCIPCNCDPTGSRSLQCNIEGKCQCKPGVTGDKCDRCEANYFDFSPQGCQSCACSEAGSLGNHQDCDPFSGVCRCKENVEGRRCRECKPGFFNLDVENEFGCTPCFCYGHSSECASASDYSKYRIESNFAKSGERWRAEDDYKRTTELQFNAITQSIGVSSQGDESIYFLAPERYLGDQRASYNQLLQFSLRIGENRAVPTATDIMLEGAGSYVTNTIFAQRNQIPSISTQQYQFRLHEHPDYGWQPRLSARAFISILTNLTAIRVRGTYTSEGVGFLDDVKLETASRGLPGTPANWVELCNCPTGYVGQFCESCAPEYRHFPSHGGPFNPCIPCDCNKHADICDSETGRCICQHNTSGDNCEFCARGYYGNALGGTPYDCQPCGCPNGGACIQLDEDVIMCVECPNGYTGHRCDSCSDGYFGDPTGRVGPPSPCQPCECNLNIDPNAIGNCNTTTGECLKCIHNTGGQRCDQCLPGYYGDALSLPKGDCHPCECYPPGTKESADGPYLCDQISGECSCKPHVQGRNCDQCEDGFYNIISGEGCQTCSCDPVGSLNHTCNLYTGQCHCRPGITGQHCDRCEDYKYGFSIEGCKSCNCDPIGSKGPQCDPFGQCPCLDNVEGRQCDRCKENKYDRQRGCINCPDCYNLVQDASRRHSSNLDRLRKILDDIMRNPTVISDDSFEAQLKEVQDDVEDLNKEAKLRLSGEDEKTVAERLEDIEKRQREIERVHSDISENIEVAVTKADAAERNVTEAEKLIQSGEDELKNAVNTVQVEGKAAMEKAQERAKEFGQQSSKMTEIAQSARETAENLEEHADGITDTANEAKNKSNEAYEMAKNTSDQQRNISQDVRFLRGEIANTESKLKRIKQWTGDAHNKSTEAKKKALALRNEVSNLIIPEVDVPKLKQETETIKLEAQRLINDTRTLDNENENVLSEIQQQMEKSREVLELGNDVHITFVEILADMDLSREQARKAVELGNKTLNEAKATYVTLSHFDKQVKESKEAANQALEQIPDIQRTIDEAIGETEAAEGSLSDAQNNAKQSLKTAQKANDMAKNSSINAHAFRKEAQKLHQNATNLNNEVNLMEDRVNNTKGEFNALLNQFKKNESLITEAKDKVGVAEQDSQAATKKVTDILADVEGIITELGNLPDLEDEELDRLEEELKKAEQRVRDAQLDKILEKLYKEQKEQNAIADAYKAEIERLRKEVDIVAAIANALPDGCFRKLQLEP